LLEQIGADRRKESGLGGQWNGGLQGTQERAAEKMLDWKFRLPEPKVFGLTLS
jgi:hypothetical protein